MQDSKKPLRWKRTGQKQNERSATGIVHLEQETARASGGRKITRYVEVGYTSIDKQEK